MINHLPEGLMRGSSLRAYVVLACLLPAAGCGRNTTTSDVDASTAVRDTMSDSVSASAKTNQTESGMTDSSGQSTLGSDAEKTRPDQGQPVTSKGDTINPGVDSSGTSR
jgi:hypothetical protein